MDVRFALFLMTGAMLLAAQSSDALVCYLCRDPPEYSGLAPCNQATQVRCAVGLNWCVTFQNGSQGGGNTLKGCFNLTKGSTGCYDVFEYGTSIGKGCTCTTDLCNNAETVDLSKKFLIISTVVVGLLLKVVWRQ